jgi:hypothetical protein
MFTRLLILLLTELEARIFNVVLIVSIILISIWVLYQLADSIKRRIISFLGIPPKLTPFDRLLIDKNFVSDLRDIIEEEGGVYKFMDKMRPLIHHENWDHDNFWSVRSFTFKNVAGVHARPIIEKIIKTKGFTSFLENQRIKYAEIEIFSNSLWVILSQSSFRKIYLRMLTDVGIDTQYAIRDMTEEEKRDYFDID